MKIRYLGLDHTGPKHMQGNPYVEGSREWNAVVDFACMPTTLFTLDESAAYHGIETSFYDDIVGLLADDGIIEILGDV